MKDYPNYEIDVKLCAFTGSEMDKEKKEFDAQMDENGNYHYGYFDEYFTGPRRTAYFIYNDAI